MRKNKKIVIANHSDYKEIPLFLKGNEILEPSIEMFLEVIESYDEVWIHNSYFEKLKNPKILQKVNNKNIKIFYKFGKKIFYLPLEKGKILEHNSEIFEPNNTDELQFLTDEPQIKNLLITAEKISKTNSAVLITGETGTGKELLARLIQKKSDRSNQPFVKVNCAAIPHTLIEAELFGYKKGAFTGANYDSLGKFRLADGGTIFLDEIGDIPLDIQPKLLRVLDYNSIQPLGGSSQIQVDTRLIAATNVDIEKNVAAGIFRSDLYYRINVFRLHLPPLKHRPRDVLYLFNYFIKEYSKKHNTTLQIKDDFKIIKLLQNYSWPGNIRQLRNLCENLFIGNNIGQVSISNIEEYLNQSHVKIDNLTPQYKKQFKLNEKKIIKDALQSFNFNITKTSSYLEMSRIHLYRKIKEYKIIIEREKN